MQETLYSAYFIVFGVLVVSELLYLKGKSPHDKWRLHARLALLNIVIIGGFMVAIVLSWGQWTALALVVGALGLIGYLVVTKIRVCQQCGTTVQPANLVTAARFCTKCGGPLFPSPLRQLPEASDR